MDISAGTTIPDLAKLLLEKVVKSKFNGTMKSYVDPRITFAWCKQYQLHPDRIFTDALLKKFVWAQVAPAKGSFESQLPKLG